MNAYDHFEEILVKIKFGKLTKAEEHTLLRSLSAPTAVKEAGGVGAGLTPDPEAVICPECCSQFRAIPTQVQALLLAAGHEPPFRAAQPATPVAPIDMVLHCPACGKQHIDKPEGQFYPGMTADESVHTNKVYGLWDNPPHRSHQCHGCGRIWRPADVPTNGVAAVKTKGKADSPIATPATPKTLEALTEHHKLDTDRQVFFYEQDFYVLSNFSSFNLKWRGLVFPTSEHAYHWAKFASEGLGWGGRSDIAHLILTAPSAHEAFKTAERMKAYRRADWDDVKVGIMLDILRAKAEQHEYVRRKLLATGDRELIEDSWRDDYWGWGPNRDGQNVLGKLWMQVREELRAAKNNMTLGAPDGN